MAPNDSQSAAGELSALNISRPTPHLLKMNIVKTSTNAPVREDELYEKWMSQQSLQSSSHPALKQKTHLASFWVQPFFI